MRIATCLQSFQLLNTLIVFDCGGVGSSRVGKDEAAWIDVLGGVIVPQDLNQIPIPLHTCVKPMTDLINSILHIRPLAEVLGQVIFDRVSAPVAQMIVKAISAQKHVMLQAIELGLGQLRIFAAHKTASSYLSILALLNPLTRGLVSVMHLLNGSTRLSTTWLRNSTDLPA